MARGSQSNPFRTLPAPSQASVNPRACFSLCPDENKRAEVFDESGLVLKLSSTANSVLSDDDVRDSQSFLRRIG